MVIEAGLPLADLKKILESIASTSQEADVRIVAGDTKVVRKGEVDKIFINTSGIGVFRKDSTKLTMPSIKEDDDVIVTGQIGNHSVHILSIREGLGYEERVLSDCAPLNKMIGKVLKKHTNNIHYMRDLTRGGLGSALNEISTVIKKSIEIRSYDIPIQQETQMAADMLGINPIYLANEGTLVIFCSPDVSNDVIAILKADKYGKKSSIIGKVKTKQENHVISVNKDGEIKIIDHLYGQELPRLC